MCNPHKIARWKPGWIQRQPLCQQVFLPYLTCKVSMTLTHVFHNKFLLLWLTAISFDGGDTGCTLLLLLEIALRSNILSLRVLVIGVGSFKALDMTTCTFGWPDMRGDYITFIESSLSYQSPKVHWYLPQGLIKPITIPDQDWSSIGVDPIVRLTISDGYASVMVVVNQLSKVVRFLPAQE